jgi:hypothetical protein
MRDLYTGYNTVLHLQPAKAQQIQRRKTMGNAAEGAGGSGGGSASWDKDAINAIFAASGVGPLTLDELAAANAILSRGDEVPITNLPRDKQAKIEIRRLGVTSHATRRGCRGVCDALAGEIRIERDFYGTTVAATGANKISPDYQLVESLCGILCCNVEDIREDETEMHAGTELREVTVLMNMAMDTVRQARRQKRMKLLGGSYVGRRPDSLEDTDSDAASDDSMMSDHDDADGGVASNSSHAMPGDDGTREFRAGTSDEDKYVNPDEGVFADRGKLRACYMSLRACCEFLSLICQQHDQPTDHTHENMRNAIKTSGAVTSLARLLRQHAQDNELMFWGINALFFCLRDGPGVDHDNVQTLLVEGKGVRLTEKLRRSCRYVLFVVCCFVILLCCGCFFSFRVDCTAHLHIRLLFTYRGHCVFAIFLGKIR